MLCRAVNDMRWMIMQSLFWLMCRSRPCRETKPARWRRCTAQGSVLFTGDMGEERERGLQLQQYAVLKAGHHGSHYSSSMEFLEQVQPKLTVISCGRGNRYGHPHQETLERLQAIGSNVVRTDELGCIKVVFDAEGIKCYGYADLQ